MSICFCHKRTICKTTIQIMQILTILTLLLFSLNVPQKIHSVNCMENHIPLHLSFNPLISFPDKIFNENYIDNNIVSNNNLTINEFEKILENLYQNGYILVDIFDYINIEKNSITLNQFSLPENRKPLILSFDNVTYINNYQNRGQIDKIILDRNYNLASYTTKKSIQDKVQYDNEFILILENFIKTHKDFSFNNARGIIFFTGEHGILGYNICHKNTNHSYEVERVIQVINKLKSLGWKFGANEYFTKEINSNIELIKSIMLWKDEIENLVGYTPLFATMHSSKIFDNISNTSTLVDNNFKILFSNEFDGSIINNNNFIILPRKKITVKSITNNNLILNKIFDTNCIWDNLRHIII